MKTVFSNRELAHVWASQAQREGRGSNFFFDGPSLFSYGRHFEVARVMPELLDGSRVVLFNSRRYSVSTAKHQSYARDAASHLRVFVVPSMLNHAENVEHYLKNIDATRAKVVRARWNAAFWEEETERMINDAARYVETFKKDLRPFAALVKQVRAWEKRRVSGKLFTPAERADIGKRIAAQRERARKAEERRREAAKIRDAELFADMMEWARGDRAQAPYEYSGAIMLRVKDGRVETSRGAQITERTARALWAALVRGADVVGQVLDNYTVNKWDGAVLTVGCHDIPAAELVKIAGVLGLPGALPVNPLSCAAECAHRRDEGQI